MAELGVTQEQFMDACEKAGQKAVHKKIVDQLIAVENFMAFKKLMVKRNSELNQQPLMIITKKEIANKMKAGAGAEVGPGQTP